MFAIQKIISNGNSAAVTVPQVVMRHFRWFTGDFVVLEMLEGEKICIRRATEADLRAMNRLVRPATALPLEAQ